MIAWVSELTHGGHVFTFEDPALEEQAQQEKECPVWAVLQEATRGEREGLVGVSLHVKVLLLLLCIAHTSSSTC